MILHNIGSLLSTETTRIVNLGTKAVGFCIVSAACPLMSVSADGGLPLGLSPAPGAIIPLPAKQRYVFRLPTVFTFGGTVSESAIEDWQSWAGPDADIYESKPAGKIHVMVFHTVEEMRSFVPGMLLPLVVGFSYNPGAFTAWSLANMLYTSMHMTVGNTNGITTWQVLEGYLDGGIATGTTTPASDDPDLRENGGVLAYISAANSPNSRRGAVTIAHCPYIQAVNVYTTATSEQTLLRFGTVPQTVKVLGISVFRYLQTVTVGTVTAGVVLPNNTANGTVFGLNTSANTVTTRVGRYAIDANGDWLDLASNALAGGAHAGGAYRIGANVNFGNFPCVVFESVFSAATATILWELQVLH